MDPKLIESLTRSAIKLAANATTRTSEGD